MRFSFSFCGRKSILAVFRRNMSEQKIVTTGYGKLRGGTATSREGREYFYFAGIPYAEPPVGPLRFKPPIPHKKWDGVRDALMEGKQSLQVDMFTKKLMGAEDCLFVNVYTPKCEEPLKPVIVWIHGGAFGIGSGGATLYGGKYLMDQDVVLVTFNYRLGALGFLNLDLEDAAGNMGMKDQTLLLKWVKSEIRNFGGDPNNVTISGSSAGGASVHYHMVSPLSRGLFHKAIAQSGTIPCEWAFMKDHYRRSTDLGPWLHAESTDRKKLLDYYMTLPAEQFPEMQNLVVSDDKNTKGNNWAFVPSIETVGEESKRFLSTDPYQLLVNGISADVPFLTGINTHEGFLIPSTVMKYPILLHTLNSDFKVLFEDLEFPSTLTAEEISTLANRVRIEYFKNEVIEYPKHFNELVSLYGNTLITVPALLTLNYLKNKRGESPVFFYKFSVDTPHGWYKQNLIKNKVLEPHQKGVSHCDELGYLFSNALTVQFTSKEPDLLAEKTIRRMTKMWVNFANSGDPSDEVKWKPVFASEKPMGLHIGAELSFGPIKELELESTFKELFKISK